MKLSNAVYDRLKIVRFVLMIVATLYLTIGEIWAGIVPLPYPEQIAATIMAIATALDGTLLDSSKKYAARINGKDGVDTWDNV